MCIFFDFPPSTYVLPIMFAIQVVLVHHYSILTIFRAWIAKEENKISGVCFILYSLIFIYLFLSATLFSNVFAVQPVLNNPSAILAHAIPFTNLIISFTLFQIAVSWLGVNVFWNELNPPKCFLQEPCLEN